MVQRVCRDIAAIAAACAVTSCGTSSASKTTPAPDASDGSGCQQFSASDPESKINGALATAADGACFAFGAGTYKLNNQLALGSGNGVTVKGAGMGKTIFDFSGIVTGDDAIFAQSVKNLVFEDFTVRDTPGNAIKVLGSDGVTFDGLEVTWSGAPSSNDGPYALYPVQCTNILIQNSRVSGASDSGIYVGQSKNIVVQKNELFDNVAGIEIENSYSADVHDNNAHDNAAGILVFSLPDLQQLGCHDIRVYDNTIAHNNTPNFAAKDDIVSIVPTGTGSFVMACDHVELFGNTIADNQTGSFGILSYYDTQLPIKDKNYYPLPSYVYLHDNTYSGNGTAPSLKSQFGLLLATGTSGFPGGHVGDATLYDGIVDPSKGTGPNPMHICTGEKKIDFCDLNLGMLNTANSNLAQIVSCTPPMSPPFSCSLPATPAVALPAGM